MIEKIAIRLSNAWGENGVVTTEDVECYRYGLELMISTIFNFIFHLWTPSFRRIALRAKVK